MGWDGDAMGQGDVTDDPASSAATTDRPRALRPRPETGPLAAMLRSHQAFAANLPGGTRISLKFCDLAGIDLSGRKLAGADFTQADIYKSTGISSGSGSGGVVVIIFVAIGLLIAVPVLITIRRLSKSS